jgi:hypothetical protein
MAHYLWGVLGLLLGFLLLVYGTSECRPWQNPLKSERMRRAFLLAVAIGLSGLLTTLAWNQFSSLQQERSDERFRQAFARTNQEFRTRLEETNLQFRQDLDKRDQNVKAAQEERDRQQREAKKNATVLAVAREWRENELTRARNPFARYDEGSMDESKPDPFIVLAQFHSLQAKMASNSDVFDWTSTDDQRLVICLLNYAQFIEQLNMLCDMLNMRKMTAIVKGTEDAKVAANLLFGEKGAYKIYLGAHTQLGDVLKKNYPWVFDDIGTVGRPPKEPDDSRQAETEPRKE